jgi:ankyrin repeat protein
MENTNKHWVLYADNTVKDLHSINNVPEHIVLNDWISGKQITIPKDKNIQISRKCINGDHWGDMPLSKYPFFHKDFIDYLNEFGIDNIQYQPVDVIEDDNKITDYDHYLLNITSPLQHIKEYNINIPPIAGPERFEIDTSKTNGLHIFRIAENPKLIIISDKLNSFLTEKELACIKTIPTQEYLKSDNLSLEELSKTKELISFVEKLKYGKEPFDQKIVESLLSEGADVNYYNPGDWTSKPAIVLAQNISNDTNRRNMMILLFNWGVDVNRSFQYGYLIEEAASDGDIEGVNFLITNGAVDGYEDALCNAIEKNHINIVKLLVEKGANINNPPALKSCSEAYRCKYKENSNNPIPGLSTAEYLISKGADVNNSEAFYSGIQNNFKEFVELLLKKGSTLLKTEKDVFLQAQSPEMIHLLAKLGFDPLELNASKQSTYLMDSIFWGDKPLFEAFLKYDIDLYATDIEGKTAFHYGLRSEQKKIIEYLITIYDLKKVHKIKSVFGIAENPAIQELLKEKLNIEYTNK